jgi:hypothetical protein
MGTWLVDKRAEGFAGAVQQKSLLLRNTAVVALEIQSRAALD